MKPKEYVFSNGEFDFYIVVRFEIHEDNNGNKLALPECLDMQVSITRNGTDIGISDERYTGDEMMMLWEWAKEKDKERKKIMGL